LVLGRGLGGHYELTDVYADLYRSTKKSEDLDPHNDYLSLLFQLGPIALVSYLSMQVLAARQGLELHRRSADPFMAGFGRFIVALTAVTSVTNFLSNSFIQRVTVAWLFWGMVGVVYSMRRELPDEAPPSNTPPPRLKVLQGAR
jgi:O-antigen ligase